MNITKEEAIRLLGRYDTEYYTPPTREAHRMGIAALNRVEELEKELADERHRHDRLQDFEVSEAKELEFQKNATIRLRKQWQEAECLICTMCGHCEYEIHGDTLCMQLDCGEVVGYPCCGKFIPRNRWIPVTERLPEQGQEVIVYDGGVLKPKVFCYLFWDKHFDSWARVTHWMPLPEAPKEVE